MKSDEKRHLLTRPRTSQITVAGRHPGLVQMWRVCVCWWRDCVTGRDHHSCKKAQEGWWIASNWRRPVLPVTGLFCPEFIRVPPM